MALQLSCAVVSINFFIFCAGYGVAAQLFALSTVKVAAAKLSPTCWGFFCISLRVILDICMASTTSKVKLTLVADISSKHVRAASWYLLLACRA